MKTELIKSDARGVSEQGWLHSRFSFSFAEYMNPDRMNFGALRVLNDDIIEPGKGFGFHPHNNMEIISIPLAGALEHKDSMGNTSVIEAGDIQIMSAGSGIVHAEYNPSRANAGNFLQIWIIPRERNLRPRYQQLSYKSDVNTDSLLTVVSPEGNHSSLFINQDAYIAIGKYGNDRLETYSVQKNGNGVFLFVIEGKVKINDVEAERRDAVQVTDAEEIKIEAAKDSHLLVIEVPM
jgi:redox-sensitive bicupin YhaK (pirin superfamily)